MGPRRDANRPRRSIRHSLVQGGWSFGRSGHFGWHFPHPRASFVIVRYVDVDLAQKLALSIENLNAPIAAVSHIHIARIIRSDTVRCNELAWTSSRFAPGLDPVSIFIDLGNP